jgi:polyisoprenoid-binding protein YceI
MSRSGLLFASALLLASTIGQVWAANTPELSEVAGKYTVTPSSRIAFSVAQVGGGGIKGVFGKFSGSFTLEAAICNIRRFLSHWCQTVWWREKSVLIRS